MFIHDMFVLTIPWIEKVIRPVIVYFAMVLLLRPFGKRELAQLNPFDLVVLLCLANTLQNAIIGDDNTVIGGLIGAFSLLLVGHGSILAWASPAGSAAGGKTDGTDQTGQGHEGGACQGDDDCP